MKYREIHKELLKKVRRDYGKKCKSFHYACPVCEVYMMLDILENCASLEDSGIEIGRVKFKTN